MQQQNYNNMKKIVICGGHFSPALAVIEKLQKRRKFQVYYFGRKNPLEGDMAESLEYQTLSKLNISFNFITTGRIQRSLSFQTIPSLFKLPIGFFQSFYYLLKIKPDVVVSFGGYVAFPVCVCAWILRIPIITHEQTHVLGLVNKIISKMAKVLCLSYKDTENVPSGVKTELTGNPIRKSIDTSEERELINFGNEKLPLLYITGGSLGSKTINAIIAKIIQSLCKNFRILHQTGNANGGEDFLNLSQIKNSLDIEFKNNFQVIEHIKPSSIGAILKNSFLVIGRAGANTVNEILAVGVPAILIPLPWAGQNEQKKNALLLKSIGLGEIILQSELTPALLLSKIEEMQKNIKNYQKSKLKAKEIISESAAEKIVQLIEEFCQTV